MDFLESIEVLVERYIRRRTNRRKRPKFNPRKLTRPVRRKIKKARFRAHRGTNWKLLKPRKGYKRVKVPGTKRYIFVRLKQKEKFSKGKLMRRVRKIK